MSQVTPTHLPKLTPRPADSHKGSFGRALLVGGSRGMTGAIALAGMAALRAGAGLVRLAVPYDCLDVVASFEPSYLTAPLPADDEGRLALAAWDPIRQLADQATCVACGPGLGRSPGLARLVCRMFSRLGLPMVVDADGLNALADMPEALSQAGGPRVLTPHPGEFKRLIAKPDWSMSQLRAHASDFARQYQVVLVLKGHRSLISDGQQTFENTTGNPGMATGGTGDVLTGIITALICQGLSPFDAARLGVYIHGLAGDLAAVQLGEVSLIASDLLRFLPEAIRACA